MPPTFGPSFRISLLSCPRSSLLPSSSRSSCLLPTQSRPASHQSEGRANRAARGPGKRLGAKKGDSELVVPGNIIFRQRGSIWHPGENVVMGRDHTISALVKGYVRYYRDPNRNPDKQYIGVVFDRDDRLPHAARAPRSRRVGMDPTPLESIPSHARITIPPSSSTAIQSEPRTSEQIFRLTPPGETLPRTYRPGYAHRETNTSIGREAERVGIKIKPYSPKDRWAVWRERSKVKRAEAERNALKRKTKAVSRTTRVPSKAKAA